MAIAQVSKTFEKRSGLMKRRFLASADKALLCFFLFKVLGLPHQKMLKLQTANTLNPREWVAFLALSLTYTVQSVCYNGDPPLRHGQIHCVGHWAFG